jgi:hypothetical protein
MDPYESARMFFEGGHTGQPGLFDKKTRDQMGLGEAAQAVQVSAFPDRYALQESAARDLLGNMVAGLPMEGVDDKGLPLEPVGPSSRDLLEGGLEAPDLTSFAEQQTAFAEEQLSTFLPNLSLEDFQRDFGDLRMEGMWQRETAPVFEDGVRGRVADYAMQFLGTPYVWGGSAPGGFDCSGLMQYVYAQFGVELPRISYAQARFGSEIGQGQARVGDLVAWDNSSRNNGADHIAMYLGDGWILEAPRAGENVRKRRLGADEQVWFVDMNNALGGGR